MIVLAILERTFFCNVSPSEGEEGGVKDFCSVALWPRWLPLSVSGVNYFGHLSRVDQTGIPSVDGPVVLDVVGPLGDMVRDKIVEGLGCQLFFWTRTRNLGSPA